MGSQTLTLHIWPSKWDLPSIEPSCIVAAFYLHLALPGRFSIQECTNPDASPSGQLPYLTHGHHSVAPLSSIVKYVAALSPASVPHITEADAPEPAFSADVDVLLGPSERAKRTAWIAHVESALGDLVAHAFYSVPANYAAVTHPILSSFFKPPQSYYVPRRIRQAYQARLEANSLWVTSAEESEVEKPKPKRFGETETEKDDPKHVFKNTFQREKVLEKSRAAFSLYAKLLGDTNFFFYDRPTMLDLSLAAHILLLIHAPLPDTLLSSHLSSSFPALISHARRVLAAAMPTERVLPPKQYRLSALLPYSSFRAWWNEPRTPKNEEEKRFERMRWRWIGLAILGSVGYWFIWGPTLRLVKVEDEDGDENLAIVVGGDADEDIDDEYEGEVKDGKAAA
ncbi:hypothetical protein F5148DRAFT_1173860 [Russula earlei]|uniref:Uncharacterized protein n=1 Tax=Russula earlei TaxID=71964 RepID=A0ACC0UHK2_9AGAM|nr:hypothetical protein F5148DRAFT_1173860 [Russula earlei]